MAWKRSSVRSRSAPLSKNLAESAAIFTLADTVDGQQCGLNARKVRCTPRNFVKGAASGRNDCKENKEAWDTNVSAAHRVLAGHCHVDAMTRSANADRKAETAWHAAPGSCS